MKKLVVVFLVLHASLFALAQDEEVATFSSLKVKSGGREGDMLDFNVSRSQRYILIAYENKIIKVLDGTTGKFLKELKGYHKDPVEVIALPGDQSFLSIGLDNSIALIDINSGNVLSTTVLPDKLRCADVNKEGTVLVTGDSKGSIRFVGLPSLKEIKQIKTEAPQVTSLAFSNDFTKLAAGTGLAMGNMFKKLPILIIDPIKMATTTTLEGAPGATTSLKFSADDQTLYFGHKASRRVLRKWDLKTNASTELKGFVSTISASGYNGLEISDDNSVLVATTDDQSIEVYDLKTGEPIVSKGRGKVRMIRKLDYAPRNIFSLNKGKIFIVGGFNKSMLYILNAAKKGVTGYIHSFNEEWAVIAADGRMEGSAEAIKNLAWKDGYNEIPLDNTFEVNYTPRLLSILINENEVRKEFEVKKAVSDRADLYFSSINGKTYRSDGAATTYVSEQKKITLGITILNNADKIKEVKLYHNSKLAGVKQNGDKKGTEYLFEVSLTNAFGPENFIYVTAQSNRGIDSEKKTLTVTYTGKTDTKPSLYLLTVGINQYKNPKYNLNFAQADADAFEQAIKTGSASLFENKVAVRLRDGEATKSRVIAEIKKIQLAAKEQDLFIFYYAGHGVMSEGKVKESEFFLVPYDVTQLYGKDEFLTEKAISASELKEASKNINAQKQVFILDACQSSGALETFASRGAAEEKAIAHLARSTGTYWITATGTEQFATEFNALKHGVFTYALLDGMKGAADNGDKSITIKELSAFVELKVPELSEKYKGKAQYPSGYSYGNDFPLVILK